MSEARFIIGDVRDVLATLPDNSVDLVFTSPPFLALRSYLPADHPDKGKEIGSEPDPGAFIDTLLAVTEDLERVLAPHGSLCVELGDTYSGTGGATDNRETSAGGNDLVSRPARNGRRVRQEDEAAGILTPRGRPGVEGRDVMPGWPLAKSACLIPELYRIALTYGRNPLTGRGTPCWRVRNTIRWCRPNPPVGALGDKFRPATSEVVVACKARDRYFDLDAVRQPPSVNTNARTAAGVDVRPNDCKTSPDGNRASLAIQHEHASAPPLDWWKLSTHGYPGAHYATFPPALVTIPLLSMCPERVCTECGQPSRRITERSEEYEAVRSSVGDFNTRADGQGSSGPRTQQMGTLTAAESITVGWTDCGHNQWRRGIVLDPFGGSGTVAEVATGHGRDAILIDIDERNAALAYARIGGLFLTIERA